MSVAQRSTERTRSQPSAEAAPTRVERRKARTIKAILLAAEEEFLAQGFHNTTVERIAEAADVSVGSLYVYFESKEGLYLALLERALEVEERYMREAFKPTLSLGQQLFAAGDAYLSFYRDHPGYFRILFFPHVDARREQTLPSAARRLAERAEEQVRRVAGIIELAVRTGAARPVDPYRTAKFMWGAWSGVIALNLRPDRLRLDDDELEAVLEQGQRVLAEGMAAMALRQPDGSLRPEFDAIRVPTSSDQVPQSSGNHEDPPPSTPSTEPDKGASS